MKNYFGFETCLKCFGSWYVEICYKLQRWTLDKHLSIKIWKKKNFSLNS